MEQELNELLTSQLDRLYRFAYNRLHDESAAEDLTQDIVECAIRSYHKIDDPERRIPWLWGIARNVYLRALNAKSRRETPAEDIIMIIDAMGLTTRRPKRTSFAGKKPRICAARCHIFQRCTATCA